MRGRLYGLASAGDYCSKELVKGETWNRQRCLGTATHYQGPWALLMRQVVKLDQLGEIFWLRSAVPAGYGLYKFRTFYELEQPQRSDAEVHLASLVNTSVPSMAPQPAGPVPFSWTMQGERSLYHLPGQPSRLHTLIRWDHHPGGCFSGENC